MITQVYFVRHAQSDSSVREGRIRPLTDEGLRDSKAVTWVLQDKGIDFMISSPYKRSMDTITDLAQTLGMEIHTDEDFRERNAGGWHSGNNGEFFEFIRRQWADFDYSFADGECLRSVQERNIRALERVLREHEGERIVIGTHGTALSTILNYYYPQYDYDCFMKIVDLMPFVIRVDLDDGKAVGSQIELIIHKVYKHKHKQDSMPV